MGRRFKHFSKEDIHMVKNTWKNAQHCLLLEKCKSKWQWGITPHQSEWPSSKNIQIINAGEDVEKREPSCTVGGNVNWYATMENNMEISLKTRNTTNMWPISPITGHVPWENHNWKRHMYPSVHWRTIYNSQDMEANLDISQRMNG